MQTSTTLAEILSVHLWQVCKKFKIIKRRFEKRPNHRGEEQRLRRGCAYAQSRQSLFCSPTCSMDLENGSGKKKNNKKHTFGRITHLNTHKSYSHKDPFLMSQLIYTLSLSFFSFFSVNTRNNLISCDGNIVICDNDDFITFDEGTPLPHLWWSHKKSKGFQDLPLSRYFFFFFAESITSRP